MNAHPFTHSLKGKQEGKTCRFWGPTNVFFCFAKGHDQKDIAFVSFTTSRHLVPRIGVFHKRGPFAFVSRLVLFHEGRPEVIGCIRLTAGDTQSTAVDGQPMPVWGMADSIYSSAGALRRSECTGGRLSFFTQVHSPK